ncbi:hypothetical protein DEFDS_1212 [Deferribacter desulfuricans SSM1]|uniref:histidine kinase n=1 Tax=Deferribacter desulfuricans (strain DSM 14783 / JCM 11476 / NBRC 101012 / SSM1) TaxID=639282 RepID=D3PDK7_DEFDS|nr:response regulator [Deferribacter desulfuricans]BAI80680.1 hypothetical protein DEFDS_1212 [Deferribacter desulfuricans SSM1]
MNDQKIKFNDIIYQKLFKSSIILHIIQFLMFSFLLIFLVKLYHFKEIRKLDLNEHQKEKIVTNFDNLLTLYKKDLEYLSVIFLKEEKLSKDDFLAYYKNIHEKSNLPFSYVAFVKTPNLEKMDKVHQPSLNIKDLIIFDSIYENMIGTNLKLNKKISQKLSELEYGKCLILNERNFYENGKNLLFFVPIYNYISNSKSKNLKGYVVGNIPLEKLKIELNSIIPKNIYLNIYEGTAGPYKNLIYSNYKDTEKSKILFESKSTFQLFGDNFTFLLKIPDHFYNRLSSGLFTYFIIGILIFIVFILLTVKNVRSLRKLRKFVNDKTKELLEKEERLSMIFESAPNAILLVNENGELILANKRAEEVFGYKENELIGKKLSLFIPDRFRKPYLNYLINEMNDNVNYPIKINDIQLKNKEGKILYVDISIGKIQNKENKVELIFIIKDITDRKLLEKERLKRIAAEEANKVKSNLLATISHEIRTPLNAVTTFLDIMEERKYLKTEDKYLLEKTKYSSNILINLINDVLDLSKIESGNFKLVKNEISLIDLIIKITSIFENSLLEKKLKMYIDIPPDVPDKIKTDDLRLSQILINLIGNAIKFTDNGYILLSVNLEKRNDKDIFLKITVKDTGIGIEEKNIKSIFLPFIQENVGDNKKYGGTGLGLAIVKLIVEKMGGTIKIESKKGKGSKFIFDIPVECIFDDNINKQNVLNRNLLIISDNEIELKVMTNLVKRFVKPEKTVLTSNPVNAIDNVIKWKIDNKDDCLFIIWLYPSNETDLQVFIKRIKEKCISLGINCFEGSCKNNILVIYDKNCEFFKIAEIKCISKHIISPSIILDEVININSYYLLFKKKPLNNNVDMAGAKILLVEDNKINQLFLSTLLKQKDIVVDIANNGLEAIEKVKTNNYDLIFMDIQMPQMDGYETTKKIRKFNKSIPIIALTAAALVHDKNKALEAGMNDHLSKPVNKDELFLVLSKFIVSKDGLGVNEMQNNEIQNINKILDKEKLMKLVDDECVRDSLKLLKKDLTTGKYKDLINKIKNGDNDAEFLVHSLKGVAGMLTLNRLFKILEKINENLKNSKPVNNSDLNELDLAIKEVLDISKNL